MLLCGIDDIKAGMTVVASVMHPDRPETELINPGVELDARMLSRLKDLGVDRVWIDHDAAQDLDKQVKLGPSPAHQAVYEKLKASIRDNSARTISAGTMLAYRQAVSNLVCELMGSPALATLAERMSHCNEGDLFRHGANVAYLSVLIGLQMETYIVKQRSKLATEHAKDLTALGIGAMLHDIGKLGEPSAEARDLNALSAHRRQHAMDPNDVPAVESFKPVLRDYQNHPAIGYRLLEAANAPASARQVVLTHHQHWDGDGFPEMEHVTRGRKQGTQSGEQIHIFSRIVCAADLLDHLLSEADAAGRPAIAALSAFNDRAFENWMDPVIRDAVLRTVPPFPVASHVRLSDGRAAVVIAPNPTQPCLPTLRLLDDTGGAAAEPLALAEHRDLAITHLTGEPVGEHIFLLAEDAPMAKKLAKAG